jgi:hypothetical protein
MTLMEHAFPFFGFYNMPVYEDIPFGRQSAEKDGPLCSKFPLQQSATADRGHGI